MKFCRSCGASLQTTPGSPALAPVVGAPMMAPPPGMPPAGPFATPPPQSPAAAPAGPRATPAGTNTIQCPRCGTPTPVGFAYCQQCGLHLNAIAPTDPGSMPARIRPPSKAPPMGAGALAAAAAGIDPQAATLASDGGGAVAPVQARPSSPSSPPPMGRPSTPSSPPPMGRPSTPSSNPPLGSSPTAMRPATAPGAAWGTAVLVNRDGTDGQRFPLTSEDTVVGRAGADIAFDDDRFLARTHARISRASDGSVQVHPIDTTNGVFKKTEGSVELVDGAIVLVGREVLRFERVSQEERTVHPLVRHGVSLFGSPPREPWGRLVQLIPSGGVRDIRHLVANEIVLGREEGDIVFRDDAFMSRRHAAITWDGKRALLTDLGSSNGSFVRLTGPTSIKHGDHVRMGDQLMRIER